MNLRTALTAGAAACALCIAGTASAVTFTFASFSFVGPAMVSYDNATGIFSGTGIPINFNYVNTGVAGTPDPGFGTHSALLSFSAHALAPATSFGGLGFQELQLDGFGITSVAAFNGMHNLLSGNASTGVMSGQIGGSSAGYSSSMSGGATISYISDFITFPVPTDADLSWTLTSVHPTFSISGSNFGSFDATIAGTFGWNSMPMTVVPEPGPIAMLVGAGIGGLMLVRRRPTRNSA